MLLANFTASDVAYVALAIFLIAVGLTLAYVFIRLAAALQRATRFIATTEREVMPVVRKAGGTLDRVNTQLDKADVATTSAVDAVVAVDKIVRAVSSLITVPVQKLTGLVTGVKFGASNLRTHHDVGDAVRVGKEAAARREQDLAEELRREGDSR
jgi:uncharacterized protein YoxC